MIAWMCREEEDHEQDARTLRWLSKRAPPVRARWRARGGCWGRAARLGRLGSCPAPAAAGARPGPRCRPACAGTPAAATAPPLRAHTPFSPPCRSMQGFVIKTQRMRVARTKGPAPAPMARADHKVAALRVPPALAPHRGTGQEQGACFGRLRICWWAPARRPCPPCSSTSLGSGGSCACMAVDAG